jgi:hypothetical protein
MHSTRLHRLSLIVVVALLLGGVLACDLGGGTEAAKPQVNCTSPVGAIELEVGQQVEIVCMVEDPKGVASVELAVDGVLYATQESPNPEGEPLWKFVESWAAKADPGIHTLTITAYNVDKVSSDPVTISVTVVGGGAAEATTEVTLATSTLAPGTTSTVPPPGTTQTVSAPVPTPTTGAPMPTRTTAAAPTNTPARPPMATNTPVPPPTSTPVPSLPDLIVYAIYLDRDTVPYGETVHATVAVVNQGNAPAGAFRVSWDFGSGSGGQNVPCCLGPNQSYSLEWDSLPLYASYNTWAMADESQVVQESNEGNNRLARWVSVESPTVDLRLTWVAIPDRTFSGQQIYVQIGVENSGNGPAGPFVARCVVCSQECEWVVDGLGPGEEQSLPSRSATVYPPCDWQCVIDPANSVPESDEDNNTMQHRIDLIS